jgi:hypothetical protein
MQIPKTSDFEKHVPRIYWRFAEVTTHPFEKKKEKHTNTDSDFASSQNENIKDRQIFVASYLNTMGI